MGCFRLRYDFDLPAQIAHACLWGPNFANSVWELFRSLVWPPTVSAYDPHDPGITWVELVISWSLFSGYLFPIWVKSSADKKRPDCHVPYNSKEADLLHPSRKSLKNQAHTLCDVVRFLEGFFPFKLTPTYQKVHSRSLINLGFADAIHGGFCRRPLLPNPEVTSHFLQQYADHEEQQVPMTIEAAFVTTDQYRVYSPIHDPHWSQPTRLAFSTLVQNLHRKKKTIEDARFEGRFAIN